jgi:hypothetical protein
MSCDVDPMKVPMQGTLDYLAAMADKAERDGVMVCISSQTLRILITAAEELRRVE